MSLVAALLLLADAGQVDDPELGSRLKPRLQPDAAQTDKSKKAKPKPKTLRDAENAGQQELYDAAQCVVDRSPNLSRRILQERPYSKDEDRLVGATKGTFENCMTGYVNELSFGSADYRGFLAEIFYFSDFPTDPEFSKLDHIEVPLPAKWLVSGLEKYEQATLYMHKTANCVVASDPAGALALLKTKVRSKEERAAAGVLAPRFGACLDAQQQLRIDASMMRAYLAEGLFRSIKEWKPRPPSETQTELGI